MKRIACYVRVSTVGQNEAGQRNEPQRWLDGNDIPPDAVAWYVDKEPSDPLARPEFERLQRDVFAGDVATAVVWRLELLSRKLRDGINAHGDWCECGLRVVAVTQQIDSNGTVGKMLAAVLMGVAEMEQEARIRFKTGERIDVVPPKGLATGTKVLRKLVERVEPNLGSLWDEFVENTENS